MKRPCGPWVLPAFLAAFALLLPARADTLLVVCKSDFKLILLDPATQKVFARLPTERGPHEVAVSPDGRTAYVSNFGRYSVYPSDDTLEHDQGGNTITVVDIAGRKVTALWQLGTHTGPHGFAVSRDGKLVWITTETPQSVLELDAATGKILHSWNTEQERTHLVVVTPDESKFYTSNTVSGSVSIINRATGALKILKTGPGTEGLGISPDGKEVWAAARLTGDVSVISTAGDSIVTTFPSGGTQPKRIAFTPDGAQAWISNYTSNQATVFDARTHKQIGAITLSAAPSGIGFSPDGRRAYITDANANELSIVDVASRKLLSVMPVGTDPDGVVWSSAAVSDPNTPVRRGGSE